MSQKQSSLTAISYSLAEGFEINQEGVWFLIPKQDGIQKIFVCAPMHVLAYARNDCHENYSKQLQFLDPDGKIHDRLLPQELLAGDGSEVRKTLLSMGFENRRGSKSKRFINTLSLVMGSN
ncbi:DUF927 domain-containing protein [Candidatus Protochlamydia sp. R18]|uniref:DUF927 domain-containing protein n=1 Tax=Candidatus Protochlamydia sp. R18 TaxID=1353977 RepID=UPI0005A6E702|nr:DUF927 domain-containing protein [Candidatus Protochlamydia sp. R18]